MARRNNKDIVRLVHPLAKSERHKTNGNEVYWLIRIGRQFMWFAQGDTEAKAWKEAAERIERNAKLKEVIS